MNLTKLILLNGLFLCSFSGAAQTFFSENFEGVTHPNLPVGWSTSSLASDGGFYTGNSDSATVGGFWLVSEHTTFAMTNDDGCGQCDKSDDYLVTPAFDLSTYADSMVYLKFDTWMEDFWGGEASVKVDTGSGWFTVYEVVPVAAWQTRIVDLSMVAGASNVVIAFHYNDGGLGTLGLAIDDVSLFVPQANNDVGIYNVSTSIDRYKQLPYEQLDSIELSATVFNKGRDTLLDVKVQASESLSGYLDSAVVSVLYPGGYVTLVLPKKIMPDSHGTHTINVVTTHSTSDDVPGDNDMQHQFFVSDTVMAFENGVLDEAQILFEGETAAQTFNVYKKDTLTSASVNLFLPNAADEFKFFIYEMDASGGFPAAIIDSSQSFSSGSNGWYHMAFDAPIVLDSGYYAIGVRKTGSGLSGISATTSEYVPYTTFTSRVFMFDYFWFNDEQGYLGEGATHHTYLMRPNFGHHQSFSGLTPEFEAKEIRVYPNPASDQLFIPHSGSYLLQLFNVSGKLVYTYNVSNISDMYQLNLTDFQSGTYLMRITDETGVYVSKFQLNNK